MDWTHLLAVGATWLTATGVPAFLSWWKEVRQANVEDGKSAIESFRLLANDALAQVDSIRKKVVEIEKEYDGRVAHQKEYYEAEIAGLRAKLAEAGHEAS